MNTKESKKFKKSKKRRYTLGISEEDRIKRRRKAQQKLAKNLEDRRKRLTIQPANVAEVIIGSERISFNPNEFTLKIDDEEFLINSDKMAFLLSVFVFYWGQTVTLAMVNERARALGIEQIKSALSQRIFHFRKYLESKLGDKYKKIDLVVDGRRGYIMRERE